MNYKNNLNFKKPTNRYGVAPFWFLNGDLDDEELRWQVKEMKEKGLFGYVMHARYGRRVEYLSEEWFHKMDVIIKESEKLGMGAIIYDEDDWPSGMSGTKVLDDHPEYAHRQLTISWIDCKGKKNIKSDLEIEGLQVTDGEVVAAFASKYEVESEVKSECKLKDTVNITSYIKDGKLIYDNKDNFDLITIFINHIVKGYTVNTDFPIKKGWNAQPDRWSWYFPFQDYVDLMDPDAIDYFLQTTHEEYKKRYGKYFGSTVTHVFTDEPGFYTTMKKDKANAVPWTNKFPEVFKKEFDYDIIESLPALVCDIGENTTKVRHDFWFEVTKLFEENFISKYHKWCKRNNILLTGHYRLCYPQLIWQRNYAGNVVNLFRNMDVPGVDRLDTPGMCEKLGTTDSAWQIEDKILSSTAHQYGIERRMSESFALGGWGYRLTDMKRVTDWQYMMGINLIVPHAFHYSISGQRKRECPPTEFYQNPMWEVYKYYSDYICRLGEMMIGGINIAEVAVLYPMTTLWTEDVPKPLVDDMPNNIDRDFGYITDCLLRQNIDYDIIGEDEFNDTKISGRRLTISNAKYSLLIVPPMITIRKETEKNLIEFTKSGGKVIFLSMPPFKDIEGKELKDIGRLIKDEFGLNSKDLFNAYKKNDHIIYNIEAKSKKDKLSFIFAGVLKDNNPTKLIVGEIEKLIDRDFKIVFKDGKKGNIYYNHHIKDGKDIYFIHNSDEEENYEGYDIDIHMSCSGTPYFFNPESGKIEKVYFYRIVGNKTIVPYRIKPLGSIFIVFDHEEKEKKINKKLIESNLNVLSYRIENDKYKLEVYLDDERDGRGYIKTSENGEVKEVRVNCGDDIAVTLNEIWRKKLITPNVLIVDHWNMVQDEIPDIELPPASWDSVFGTKQKYLGEFVTREFDGKLKAVFDRLPEILFDGVSQPVDVLINGKKVELVNRSKFLDHDMKEVDITDLVKEGKNYIEIEFEDTIQAFEGKTGISKVSMMWDPVFIVGNFTLEADNNAENKYVITKENGEIKAKSWAEQGYPYLSGGMEYEQEFEIDNGFIDGRRCFLDAGINIREYMEVYVNGKYVDTRVWLPFRVDVTDYLKVGKNRVKIIVRNTPKNIIEKRKERSGVVGEVKIISKDIQEVCI